VNAPRSLLVGLLGHGVGPSLTPEMHEREAARQDLRYVYKIVELDETGTNTEHLRQILAYAGELGFDGLNITHPIKQTMVSLVDEVSPEVEAIGALNTVLMRGGRTFGHNTDVTGFARAFREGMSGAELGSVVLLGAGGAGTAVAHALVALGTDDLIVFDPDPARSAALQSSLRRAGGDLRFKGIGADELAGAMSTADGLVNATPVGMAAHPGSPLREDLLREELWVVDIVYRPVLTELLRSARSRGCRVLSGTGMAAHQAADAFELITGRVADRAAMIRDLDELVGGDVAAAPTETPEHIQERKH
jgi:shikimate dehydrogenase